MHFSGKISNSILEFLKLKGFDLQVLHEHENFPVEQFQDPTSWIDAKKVESYLKILEKHFSTEFPGQSFIEEAGHNCIELKAWGVLDSVLRMMNEPQDIFTQPQRFISYFISPAPPIGEVTVEPEKIQFELPISSEEFPLVVTYLQSALEALPTYMGHDMAHVVWKRSKIYVSWTKQQEGFFAADEKGHNVRPEFMQSLINTIEDNQKEIEKLKKTISENEKEIKKLKHLTPNSVTVKNASTDLNQILHGLDKPLKSMQNKLVRLGDYFSRSRQLITLLIGQNRLNAQVQEAMKRVDWDYVQAAFPHLVEDGLASMAGLQKQFEVLKESSRNQAIQSQLELKSVQKDKESSAKDSQWQQ
jgi:hypothetical protein